MSVPIRIQKYGLTAFLFLAGVFLNYYCSVSLLFGVDFLFGSTASLIVLYYFGLPLGLLAAATASIPTFGSGATRTGW